MLRPALTLLCCCICLSTFAGEIYKIVTEDGKVIYSDTPGKTGKKVEADLLNLHENTATPKPKPISATPTPSPTPAPAQPYQITITSPRDGERLGPKYKNLTLRASLNRSLDKNDYIVFYIDGVAVTRPSKQLEVTLPIIIQMRGLNTIHATISDFNGRVKATSATSSIQIIRIIRSGR